MRRTVANPLYLGRKVLDKSLHLVFLALDRFNELELGAATIEVVTGAMNLEIGISGEIVGEKTDADLKGDELP